MKAACKPGNVRYGAVRSARSAAAYRHGIGYEASGSFSRDGWRDAQTNEPGLLAYPFPRMQVHCVSLPLAFCLGRPSLLALAGDGYSPASATGPASRGKRLPDPL